MAIQVFPVKIEPKLIIAAAGVVVGISIGVFYILPNCGLSQLSLLQYFPLIRNGSAKPFTLAMGGLACLLSWLPGLLMKRLPRDAIIVRNLVGAYVATLLSFACIWGTSLAQANACLSVAMAISFGFLVSVCIRRVWTTLLMIVGLAAVQALFALLDYHQGMHVVRSGNLLRTLGSFDNTGQIVLLLVLSFSIILVLGYRFTNKYVAPALGFVGAVIFAALIITWSRNGVIIAGLSTTFIVYRVTRDKKNVIISGAIAAILICSVFVARLNGTTNGASTSRSTVGRLFVAQKAFAQAAKSNFLGVGPSNVELSIAWPSPMAPGRPSEEDLLDPRSLPLLWMMEFGILGLVLFVLLSWHVCKVVKDSFTAEGTAVGVCWLVILGLGLADVTFGITYTQPGNYLLGIFVGITLTLSTLRSAQNDPKTPAAS